MVPLFENKHQNSAKTMPKYCDFTDLELKDNRVDVRCLMSDVRYFDTICIVHLNFVETHVHTV